MSLPLRNGCWKGDRPVAPPIQRKIPNLGNEPAIPRAFQGRIPLLKIPWAVIPAEARIQGMDICLRRHDEGKPPY